MAVLPFTPRDAASLQAALGAIAMQLIDGLEHAERVYTEVQAAIADGSLSEPPFSYTADQITYVNRIVSDLHSLRQVAHGQAEQVGAYDFLAYPARETGFR